MSTSRVARALLVVAVPALVLGGILGGDPPGVAAPASAAPSPTAPVGQAQTVPSGSQSLGPAATSTPLSLDVVLAPRDPAALDAFVQQVSDPASSRYHRYLAKGEFGSRFGASPSTIARVTTTLRSEGLTPGPVSANDLMIPVQTTVAAAQSAFHVQIDKFHLPSGRVAHANTGPPQLPSAIAPSVVGIGGLSDVAPLAPKFVPGGSGAQSQLGPATSGPTPCSAASNVAGSYTANQIAHAYGYDTGAYGNARTGAGQTVALFELAGFLPSDVGTFQTCYGISTNNTMVNVAVTPVDSGASVGQGSIEAVLDIEAVSGLAPAASINVYEAPNSTAGVLDAYQQIATDDSAQTISTSWGLCEQLQGFATAKSEQLIFEQMAAQGQSIVASSGDRGSADCQGQNGSTALAVDDPASNPYVTGVGGTSLTSVGPPTTETVWNDSAVSAGAGGGGISSFWLMPKWQTTLGVNSHSKGTTCGAPGGTYCREVPDISASADPYHGYTIYYNGWQSIGGTSVSAPMWGALVSLANQGCGDRAGFLNPTLYARQADLKDITSGNDDYTGTNGGLYPSAVGYDMATGLGTPTAALFAPGVLCNSGVRSKLAVSTQPPASTAAGSNFSVGVSVQDSSGNLVTTDSTTVVSLAITSGTGTAGATLSCAGGTSATASSGVASFSCSLDRVGTGYTLTASASGLTPTTTAAFGVTPGSPSRLAVSTQPPGSWPAGSNFSVGISSNDASGNLVSTDTATVVSLAITSGTGTVGATLSCTGGNSSTVSSGVASFSCSLNKPGTGYTLTASATGLTPTTTSIFAIVPGSPSKLVVSTQPPASWPAGSNFSVGITVQDSSGNVVSTDTTTAITLTITSGSGTAGATLSCAGSGTSATVSAGVASFSCSVDKVGTGYTLTATASSLTPATTSSLAITTGTSSKLAFSSQPPASSPAGQSFSVGISVQDSSGNVENTDTTTVVSLALTSGTGTPGATLSCAGGNSAPVSAGVASFSCSVDKAGNGYTLTASTSALNPATSTSIALTPGAPSKLVVNTQPPASRPAGSNFSVGISVQDSLGNVVSTDSTTVVSLAITSGTGAAGATLSCAGGTSTTVSAGVAGFSCSVDEVGSGYTLTAGASGITPATTSSLAITTGPTPPTPPAGTLTSNGCSSWSPSGTCSVSNGGTAVTASGVGALTVSQYGSDPAGSPTFSSAGEYLDVKLAAGSNFTTVTIVDCNLNGGTSLEWWSGSAWVLVSPQSYAPGSPGCVTASLTSTSAPPIADLTGAVFGVANAPSPHPTPLPAPSSSTGYWMVGSDGGVFGFGGAGYVGSLPGIGVKVSNVVGMVPTTDGKGYWMVGSDGGVFGFGDAGYVGSLPGLHVKVSNIVGIVPTADGKGYWMVGSDGGVFGFGDAGYVGSLPGIGVKVSNIVALVPTADGKGYWMVGSDGGVFGFGDAGYVGSLPGIGVKVSDIVGMVPTADGKGYWMVGSDGGVFGFGDAGYVGSLPGLHVKVFNIVGMVPTADGNGYWMVGSDGGAFGFGDAGYVGSLPGMGVKVSNIVALVPTR